MAYVEELVDNFDVEIKDFTNDVLNKLRRDVIVHYNNIISSVLNISSPFLIGYPGILYNVNTDGEIYIQLFDGKVIEEMLCSILEKKYNEKTAEQDIKKALIDFSNIKTPEELEKYYPNIYMQYKNIKQHGSDKNNLFYQALSRYQNDFDYYIRDTHHIFEAVINNINKVDTALKNNKFIVKKSENPDTYYHILFDLVAAAALKKKLKLTLSETLKLDLPDFNIFDNYVIDLYEELKEYDKDITIYNEKIKRKITLDEVREFFNGIAYKVIKSHGQDSSIPFFSGDTLLSNIYVSNYPVCDDMEYNVLKYSGLFEFGYNHDDPYHIVIGLKNEYNNKTIYELFEIAINNLRKLKPKDIYLIQKKFVQTKVLQNTNSSYISDDILRMIPSEDGAIRVINSDNPDDNKKICNRLKKILTTKLKVSRNNMELAVEESKKYRWMLYYNAFIKPDIYSTEELLILYIDYLDNEAEENKFIKFADNTILKNEDFVKALSNVEQYLIEKIGKEKLSEILEKTKNVAYEDAKTIIAESLLKKKSIADEIEEVKRLQSKTLESDPIYIVLKHQLNKLEMYRDNFGSKEVVVGTGVFKKYKGFEYGNNIIVFDYFVDDDNKDIKTQASQNYGHAIYVMSTEDYFKFKDYPNISEVKSYINNNMMKCAKALNHRSDLGKLQEDLFKAIATVNKSLIIRDYLRYLSRTDNPVTDEKIVLTQELLDKYIREFVSNDDEIVESVKKKYKRTKAVVEREKSVEMVEKKNKEAAPQLELTDSERNELNSEIEELGVTLEKANEERKEKGLSPLSLENDNYYDVCRAIYEYQDEHKDKYKEEDEEDEYNPNKKVRRNLMVARATKERTWGNGGYQCECCGKVDFRSYRFQSHHFIPISEGGPDDIYNTVCLCSECHLDIHNGGITDLQNYMLIQTIREYITLHAPEALPKFEKTLGRIENKYLEQIEQIDRIAEKMEYDAQNEQLEIMSIGIENGMPEEEIDAKTDKVSVKLAKGLRELEKDRNRKLALANRIQDYYRCGVEYNDIEAKTLDSNKTR